MAGDVDAGVVRVAAFCAVVACVPLSLLSGWRAALVHLAAVGLGWAYNAGLKRTVLSVVPYAVAFGALPAFVTLGLPSHPWPPVWAIGAAAALGSGAHFVNTLADRDADAASGVRGLPQRLPVRLDLLLGASLLGISLLLLWRGPVDPPGAGVSVVLCLGGLSVVAVVVMASVDRPRLAWSLTLVTAVAAVAALVASGDAMGVAG